MSNEEIKQIKETLKYYETTKTELTYCEELITTGELKRIVEEIERLNNKLKDIKSQLDYLETYSSKEDVFEDMKRRLDRINKIIGSENNE